MAEDNQIKNLVTNTGSQKLPINQVIGDINRRFKEEECQKKAKELNLNYINIALTPINPDLFNIINFEEAKKGNILVFHRNGKNLDVAAANSEVDETKKIIERLKSEGYTININLATDVGILETLSLYNNPTYKKEENLSDSAENKVSMSAEKEIESLGKLKDIIESSSSKDALLHINLGAHKSGASDIHFQPEEKEVLLRFRIDGILHNIFHISHRSYSEISTQIKYNSKLIINIYDIPQDGRYFFNVNDKKIDVRVSVLPSQFGETIVCRLLDSSKKILSFEEIGFTGNELENMNEACEIKEGMVLITGPTGSGKTTTLYSIINGLNNEKVKIITLEDPIEYHINGVSQSQVNEEKGYTFPKGLRAILRQDPDIIMIGEIRDLDTATVANQASLTGHVVITTLHTNNALASIPRLVNMGLPNFMIAPSIKTIVAQRLVRRLCKDCAAAKPVPAEEKEILLNAVKLITETNKTINLNIPDKLLYPVGCEKCSNTGYKGQTVIAEVIPIDEDFKDAILNKKTTEEMLKLAKEKGLLTMYEDGITKVLQNITTFEEVSRVTSI